MNNMFKRCPRCHRWLEANTSNFFRHSASVDGLQSYCKACATDIVRDWRVKNRNAVVDYHKEYRKRRNKTIEDDMRGKPTCGEPSSSKYVRGCRCDACKKANSEYQKAYRRRKNGAA